MIEGYVKDINDNPINLAIIELKNEKFNTIIKSETNSLGYFKIDNDCESFKYLIAVKDYSINYLEYWCTNPLNDELLDIKIGKLEIYNLRFKIDEYLNIVFRPMSLEKYLLKENNICPDIKKLNIYIDEILVEPLSFELIKEDIGNNNYMDAYAIKLKKQDFSKINVCIKDYKNNIGMATIFNK